MEFANEPLEIAVVLSVVAPDDVIGFLCFVFTTAIASRIHSKDGTERRDSLCHGQRADARRTALRRIDSPPVVSARQAGHRCHPHEQRVADGFLDPCRGEPVPVDDMTTD